jgi:hypothetical protein
MSRFVTGCYAVLLAACGGNTGDDSDDGNSLGRVLDRLERTPNMCETFTNSLGETFVDIEGAERVLAVQLTFDEDQVTGRWFKVLFANEAWQETSDWTNSPAADQDWCAVSFVISGTLSEGGGPCGACDATVTYDAPSVDQSLTSCPSAYVADQAGILPIRDAFWGLIRRSDGTAAGWDTQREWAPNGLHAADGVHLWSGRACEWYGTGVQQ